MTASDLTFDADRLSEALAAPVIPPGADIREATLRGADLSWAPEAQLAMLALSELLTERLRELDATPWWRFRKRRALRDSMHRARAETALIILADGCAG